jgi:hypothetical protein
MEGVLISHFEFYSPPSVSVLLLAISPALRDDSITDEPIGTKGEHRRHRRRTSCDSISRSLSFELNVTLMFVFNLQYYYLSCDPCIFTKIFRCTVATREYEPSISKNF